MWRQIASGAAAHLRMEPAKDIADHRPVVRESGIRTALKKAEFNIARRALKSFLGAFIQIGTLQVRLPGGVDLNLGDGSGHLIRVAITSTAWCAKIAANPELATGEAYMAGGLVIEKGELHQFADLLGRNAERHSPKRSAPLSRWWLDHRLQLNARSASRRNVARHYDLPVDFYRRFLDSDLQYSCAYFVAGETNLEAAQAAKKRHLAAKLLLQPGHQLKVLDIGCGWGGMALTLAQISEARIDGLTLSTEQFATAVERARAAGLSDRARFHLTDYRDVSTRYDRIISVGMLEHVGRPNFQTYFNQIERLLEEDGVAVIHAIGRSDGPGVTQPWIAKYIFPGGYIPALSEILAAVERAGLIVTDLEILRLHYSETIRCWRERFSSRKADIIDHYGERIYRMWEFYFCFSEIAFKYHGHMAFQLQLSKRVDAVPITRDYISDAEQASNVAIAA